MSPLKIHDTALTINDPAVRLRYLEESCHGDEALRQRVEAMLRLAEVSEDSIPQVGRFLKGRLSVRPMAARHFQ
jgi:hypothetical protein